MPPPGAVQTLRRGRCGSGPRPSVEADGVLQLLEEALRHLLGLARQPSHLAQQRLLLGRQILWNDHLHDHELVAAPAELEERHQEEGAYFESMITAELLKTGEQLALYRPAVDVGRDLLIQLAGTPRYAFLQIKGTTRVELGDHVRFQVRRRTLAADRSVLYVFAFQPPAGGVGPIWIVDGAELAERCAAGDQEHLSFEARLEGPDRRWQHRRHALQDLDAELLKRLT